MLCPICGCWVDSEERLHEHYLSNCPGNPGDDMEKPGVAVRFLWNRTVTTLATEVFLLSDFSKDPMPLQWNIPDDVFESELVSVPVGLHQCQLVVGEDVHPVKKFVVEEATREVPLEILSDVAKDADRDSVDTDSLDRYSGSSVKDTKSSVRFSDSLIRDQPGAVGGVSRPTVNGKPPPWSVKGRALIQEKLAAKAGLSAMDGGRSYSQDGRSSTSSIVDRYSRPGSGNLNGYAGLNGINANGDRLSGSRGSTPPASVTSEQELSQYFDQGRGDAGYRGGTGRGSVDDAASHHSRHSRSSSARSSVRQSPVTLPSSSEQVRPREYGKRSSSVPTVQDIDRFTSDKRSYTPDTYSRLANSSTAQPIALSPLVTTRTAPVTSTVSRSSSHRSTPLSTHSSRLTNGGVENGHRQNGDPSGRMQQLEEELAMTKSQLTDRDRDYTHLSEQLQQEQDVRLGLEQEMDQMKRDQHNAAAMEIVELERKYSDILREKENLATEVFTLRRALDESQSTSRHPGESSFTEYDPNNPTVLLKKIEDMESQMRDLQEANECAVGELSRAEQEVEKVREENESLRTVNDLSIGDLREENQNLKEQIVLLTKQQQQHSHNQLFNTSDLGLDEEVKQLRQTCRQLREKNHELNEENLRLRDELRDMRRKRERAQSDKSELQEKMERYKQERQAARDEVNALNSELTKVKAQLSVYTANTPRILDQSVGISSPKIHSTPTNVLPSRFDPSPLIGSKLNGSVEDHHHSRRSFERKTPPSAYNGWDAKDALDGSPQSDASDSTTLLLAPWRPHEGFGATDDAESLVGTDTGLGSTKESSAFSSHPYPDADGYSSTDIESHSVPYRDVHTMGSSKGRRRSNSISSSSDISSFDTDTDKDYGRFSSKARQRRSGSGERSPKSRKDYIGKSSSLQSLPTMSSDTEGLLAEPPTGRRSKRSSPRGPSPPGFRSVSPKAITTQHNRDYHTMSSSTPNLSVPSRPPFVPRSPGDVQVGYKCKFSRPGGKISKGSVMYVGHLPGRSEAYLGVELDSEDGKHDGVYNGQRFFVCKPNKGVFVSFNKVIMVWG
ncbi:uncharacterized protein LOC144885727 isoform X2 [Branchiostoma floridae x Branchiostoma japonicum]